MSQNCRFCNAPLKDTFCNLGKMPPSNSYLKTLNQPELVFPLHAFVCRNCFLVQLEPFQRPDEIFSHYAYFSSFSDSWIEHGRRYTETIVKRLYINANKFVVEIASNDGYLLQHFKAKNIPLLGIEPAKNVAQAAIDKGIPTLIQFFGEKTARQLSDQNKQADLIIANNVLAHVPDIHDFASGLKILLKEEGAITLEFPHLLQLIAQNQFDTIYHEHFSYFSLLSIEKIFQSHNLEIFDVEEIATHGGSLRIYLQHSGKNHPINNRIDALKTKERHAGLTCLETYTAYAKRVAEYKINLTSFFQKVQTDGKTIVGYGAPAKGNTLLNYCAITSKQLPFTVDKSPHKQGLHLPGTHIPIYPPATIDEVKPDYLLILPWNLQEEIIAQMAHIRSWGGQFVIPIPEVRVL
jgi:SAM-dependent methyltransferase